MYAATEPRVQLQAGPVAMGAAREPKALLQAGPVAMGAAREPKAQLQAGPVAMGAAREPKAQLQAGPVAMGAAREPKQQLQATEPQAAVPPLAGAIWRLSRDREGSRAVQRALELARGDEARGALAAELRGHVWQATQCPHANYVVQRCIETMPHRSCQFILEEILKRGAVGVAKAARHPYACRVLQRLLEHFPGEKLKGLVEDLLVDGVQLATHRYGTYVMQHILEYGAAAPRQDLTMQLAQHARELGQNPYACMVLSKALRFAEEPGRGQLGCSLLQEPGLVASMAQTRHGHTAVEQLLLGSGEEWELLEAQRQLTEELASLRVNRHGRSVLKCLEESRRGSAVEAEAMAAEAAPGWLGGA